MTAPYDGPDPSMVPALAVDDQTDPRVSIKVIKKETYLRCFLIPDILGSCF